MQSTSGDTPIEDREEEKSLELTEVLAKLEQAYDDILEAFGSSLSLRNAETEGHSQRVTDISLSIGKPVPLIPNDLAVLARQRRSSAKEGATVVAERGMHEVPQPLKQVRGAFPGVSTKP